MAYVNGKTKKSVKHRKMDEAHEEHREDKAHANWMGGPSYFLEDPIIAPTVFSDS